MGSTRGRLKVDGDRIFVPYKFTRTVDIIRAKRGYKNRVDYLDQLADDLQKSYNDPANNTNPFFKIEW